MPDSSAGVVDFEIVLSDTMVGCDGRSLAKDVMFWFVCEGRCVHDERGSRYQKTNRSPFVCDTCRQRHGSEGEVQGRNEGRSESQER